jgi:acetyltransferase-like isoleucine patch superfamily enzyme
MKSFRKYLKAMLRYTPLKGRLEEGLLSVHPGIIILNFIFQRIFRVNGDVPWPVNYTSRVTLPQNIKIGKGVALSFARSGGCYIQGNNGIEIGDNTIFAPGVKIISANHDVTNLDKHVYTNPIKIGNNCWIGANAVILPGVTLGNNVIVGAGSVVTKSFEEDGIIIAGNPARIIKRIKKDDI